MRPPVVVFGYNRPGHLARTLQHLRENHNSGLHPLIIYLDGPKPGILPSEIKRFHEVEAIARSQEWAASIQVIKSTVNKGLATSIIQGVTEQINQYGSAIIIEDDIISSPALLDFFTDALIKYENNEKVISISGYTLPADNLPDAYFLKTADCWGWATWKRGWKLFEPDGNKLIAKIEKNNLIKEFDFNGTYRYFRMLQDQSQKKNDSWAIRWYASAFLADKLTLYPGKSLVHNIGNDGSGIHSVQTDFFTGKIADHAPILPDIVSENKRARKQIEKYFRSHSGNPIINFLKKTFLIRIFRFIRNKLKPSDSSLWTGNYSSFAEAKSKCSGYSDPAILDKVLQSILKVKSGEAFAERDSVLFDRPIHSVPLYETLLEIINQEGSIEVTDFGGSLGSIYFQLRNILPQGSIKSWNVIEQPAFVAAGNSQVAEGPLKFYETPPAGTTGVLILSAVLHYLEDPYLKLKELTDMGYRYILIDRTGFLSGKGDRISIQKVPDWIYRAKYPSWWLDEKKITDILSEKYQILKKFDSGIDADVLLEDGVKGVYSGYYAKLK